MTERPLHLPYKALWACKELDEYTTNWLYRHFMDGGKWSELAELNERQLVGLPGIGPVRARMLVKFFATCRVR